MSDLPWCIIGDFNDLLSKDDKKGANPHPNWLCNGFRNAVSDCDLTDIHLDGYPYTWVKSRGSTNIIEERLDRAMATSSWLTMFPEVKLCNLIASHSDHSPILLQNSPVIRNDSHYTFRFENMWLREEDVEDVVEEGWGKEAGVEVTSRVTRCADKLKKWGRRKRMKFKQEVEECSMEMERMRGRFEVAESERYKEFQEKHAKLLIQEETYWRQRAKMYWLKEGDLNTKFFHMSASARQKRKKIVKIVNEANVEVKTHPEICVAARNYFEHLFQANTTSHDPILSIITPKITQEDNDRLEAPITKDELKEALFQMHPDKAPGPDGFNPAFYQHFWNLCGNDIFAAATEWLDRGYFPSSLNETNICLIPKCDNPASMKDLRPISLCNVLYKMVSKLLANRLKGCLDKCVSEEQSAFVEGRSILDNALIAIEIIHALKRKTRGSKGDLALKIDISKAYDKVDWGFLRGMLERLGFSNRWIQWMMLCVSSVNYSVLVNFEQVGPIFPGRGLRQGDPLSPYLFILVTEGLTALIKKSMASGALHGVKICRGAPTVSHLLFADDCFLFCRSNLEETNHLMHILKTYELASGQEINLTKSEVFFSKNLSMAAQEDLSKIMGVRHVLGTGNYLGLPSMIGRKKKEIFAYIKDRVWKRINSWRGRALSKAGKEVMIKSVLQAIPSYVMSVFLLPETTIKEIERMMNSFWWGGGTHNQGIRWLAWDRMAYPKSFGGMGFRDLHSFNLSMIAKQGWNIITKPHTLVAKIYKARYFPNSSFFESHLGHNPSYAWRGIWKARGILMNGCRWSIGSGTNIKIMSDPWLRNEDGAWFPSPQLQGVHSLNLNELMLPNEKKWDKGKIESLFSPDVVNRILDTPLFDIIEEDKLIWNDSLHGEYSVKSGYNMLLDVIGKGLNMTSQERWNNIWKIQAPPKAKHLLWRICRGCIPTRTRLHDRCVPCPLTCPVCEQHNEDDWHIFFNCNDSILALQTAGLDHLVTARVHRFRTATELIFSICSEEDRATAGCFALILWTVWKNRNDKVWNDVKESGRSIGIKVLQHWQQWCSVQHHLQSSSQQQQHLSTWQKPPMSWYKCNVDAGFHKERNKVTAGWCVRNHDGNFITAGTLWQEGRYSVIEGEAFALFEALKAMQQQGLSQVIFETDSKSVVDAIHNIHGGASEFSSIICSINRILLSNPNFVVKFIKRQANMVAHTLAKAASSWARCCTFETLPLCITAYLNNEML
jgi:ribonuclease HI